MDILIKGMEMPSDEMHSVVLVFGKDGFEEARDSYSTLKIEGITAVALPSHGDLIDRDKLYKDTEGIGDYCHDPSFGELCDALYDAPVIVEATE